MTIGFLDLIVLLGALQGFIVAALLWFRRQENRLANRLLGAFLGLLALTCLSLVLPADRPLVSFFMDMAPLINVMPLGPLLYFYTQSMLDPAFRLGRSERRHFYPVALDWGAKVMGWVFVLGAILGVFPPQEGPSWGRVMDEYNTYVDIPRWLSLTAYLGLTWRWLQQATSEAGEPVAESLRPTVRWLRQLLLVMAGFQLIWLLHLLPYILPATRSAVLDAFGWYPIYVPLAVLIYWIGLRGYLFTRSHTQVSAPRKRPVAMPSDALESVSKALTTAMEADQLYLDPELTVDKVARHLQLTPKTVSLVLNQHLNKSFNTFVNEYRIASFKQRLKAPGSTHLTLTGLAFESGFNSQATFQRVFRQLTGLSPKEFAATSEEKTTQIRI